MTAAHPVIETVNGTLTLTSPYNPHLAPAARQLGGKWNGSARRWEFDPRDEKAVRDLARSIYGTDGDPVDLADLVTVHAKLTDLGGRGQHAYFGGREIAARPGRDTHVILAPGVIVFAGQLEPYGGSMKNPRIDAGDDVIVEIRDIPRKALDVETPSTYTIIGSQPDLAVLRAERDRLTTRIAEIDTLLNGLPNDQ